MLLYLALNFIWCFISRLLSLIGFFCSSSVSPHLFCQNSLYPQQAFAPFSRPFMNTECNAEHCIRLLDVSLLRENQPFIPVLSSVFQLAISPGVGFPSSPVTAELSGCDRVLWSHHCCKQTLEQLSLQLCRLPPAAVWRSEPESRSGWKWTQQIIN